MNIIEKKQQLWKINYKDKEGKIKKNMMMKKQNKLPSF